MQQSRDLVFQKSIPTRTLCAALSISALAMITGCGGGGGGAGSTAQSAPVQLGAALPASGDYIAISQQTVNLPESSRAGNVVVVRRGSSSGASSVQYRFVSESAVVDEDFHGVGGTLNWADGDSSDQTIEFVVESDLRSEGEETFKVELFNAIGNNELGINDAVDVSISDSPCNASIPTSMSGNTVLSAPCYRLQSMATFGPSGQLSISPGTTIIADSGSAISLTGTSTLQSEGNASLPVIIKGAQSVPGAWNGIKLLSSSALHRISRTEIRNAENAVQLHAGAMALFNHNVLRDNSGAGVLLPMTDANTLQVQNTFINTARGIEIIGSDIEKGQLVDIPAQSTHYVLSNGLIVSGTLTIAPGTDLRMGADVPILILPDGALSAVGSAELPIHIAGLEPRQGFWNGIQYVSAARAANRFEHVTIAHGGGDPARAGNIIVDGLGTTISLQNCALNDSAGFGIVYDSQSFQVDLTDVSFAANRLGEQSL